MDAAPVPELPEGLPDAILRDCLAIGSGGEERAPVHVRLEAAVGVELAQRLVSGLTAGSRSAQST